MQQPGVYKSQARAVSSSKVANARYDVKKYLGVCEEEVHRALGDDLSHTILALVAATSLVVNFHL